MRSFREEDKRFRLPSESALTGFRWLEMVLHGKFADEFLRDAGK